MPAVSVIIPTWNARDRLARCLQALDAQTNPAEQTLVVDNGSTDGTGQLVRIQYPWVHLVLLPENRGTAGGWNAGLRVATGAYIALLNNDAYPQPTWLEALVEALETRPDFAFAASRLLLADGSGRIDSVGDGFDPYFGGVMLGHGQLDGPAFDQPQEVFSATGAACLYRREVIEAVGGLDESLFMYSDDVDLGFRARLRGYRCLYVPDAVAYHERGASAGRNSPAQVRWIYRNGLTVYLKNMPWPLIRSAWPRVLRVWAGAVRHAPRRGAALRGVLEALWRLPVTLRKRRHIQRNRVVSVEQLSTVMTESTRL